MDTETATLFFALLAVASQITVAVMVVLAIGRRWSAALDRAHRSVVSQVAPQALILAAVSIYHLVLERYPSLESSTCDPANPCSLIWVERFG